MSFDDNVQQKFLTVAVMVRVSGIPVLFSNVGAPPQWVSGDTVSFDGDDYEWSPSLVVPDGWASITQKMQRKAGLAVSGELSFEFRQVGPQSPRAKLWLDLLTKNLNRTDGKGSSSLIEDLRVDIEGGGTGFTIANNWNQNGGSRDFYIGRETIIAGNTFGETSTIVTPITKRGAYGSRRQTHKATARVLDEVAPAGAFVTEYPIAWEGRYVEAWLLVGEIIGGRFTAYGDTADSDEHGKFYAGEITNVLEGGNMIAVRIQTASLEGVLDQPAVSFFPTAKAGLGPDSWDDQGRPLQTYIGEHNRWLHFQLSGENADSFAPRIVIDNNDNLTPGDTITIGTQVLTAVAGAPGANQFQIGVTAEQTCFNIVTAGVNGGVGFATRARHDGRTVILIYEGTAEASTAPLAVVVANVDAMRVTQGDLALRSSFARFNLALVENRGTGVEVAEGVYSIPEIIVFIEETISRALLDISPAYRAFAGIEWNTSDEKKAKAVLTVTVLPSDVVKNLTLFLFDSIGLRDSVLRDWGFDGGSQEPQRGIVAHRFVYEASRAPAAFRWPSSAKGTPGRVYLHGIVSADVSNGFNNDFTWEDVDGSIISGKYLMIEGVEVVRCGLGSFEGGTFIRWLSVLDRSVLNSEATEEKYIEIQNNEKAKEQEIYRGPAFPNTPVLKMFLYLMLGGSGVEDTTDPEYDKGWQGCGINIPPRLVEVETFESLIAEVPNTRDNWFIQKGDNLASIMDDELVLTLQQIAAGAGAFYAFESLPPSEASGDGFRIIDPSNTVSDLARGIGFDRSENRILNAIDISTNYNPATKKFGSEIKNRQAQSVATWGEKSAPALKARGLAGVGDANAEAIRLSRVAFGALALPELIVELDISTFESWLWRLGDPAKITHESLPSEAAADWGVEDMPGQIVALKPFYLGDGTVESGRFNRVTVASKAIMGTRLSDWAPSAEGHATIDGGTRWLIRDYEFGENDSGSLDASFFKAGMWVYVAERGKYQSKLSRRIERVSLATGDNSLIELSSAVPFTAPVTMWFVDYDDVSTKNEAQYSFIHFSDGKNRLVRPSGQVDPAFTMV